MSYIGIEPSYGAFEKQLLTGDGTTSTFTLDYPVGQPGQLLVSLDGIVQEPEYAFTISLSSGSPKINFADAPANGARIFIVYLGRQLLVATTANHHLSLPSLVVMVQQQHSHCRKLLLLILPKISSFSLTMFIRDLVLVLRIPSLVLTLCFQVLHLLELTIYKLLSWPEQTH